MTDKWEYLEVTYQSEHTWICPLLDLEYKLIQSFDGVKKIQQEGSRMKINHEYRSNAIQILDYLGSKGWEAVGTAAPNMADVLVLFKRRVS